jgi:hypothetical protein
MASTRQATVFTLPTLPQDESVIIEEHGELVTLVPEILREQSEKLFELYKRLVESDVLAAKEVPELRCDFFLGTAVEDEDSKLVFFHFNTPHIRRERLYSQYPGSIPLSLLERNGLVIAVVMGYSVPKLLPTSTFSGSNSSGSFDSFKIEYRDLIKRYSGKQSIREQR